jgi:starch-binding outer membrane protein, SusD/RagB family
MAAHRIWRPAIVLAVLLAAAACNDTNVPYLTAPTSVANTPTGVQNAVTGLFYSARIDVGNYAIIMSSLSRDNANFTNTEPRWILEGTGIQPIVFNDQFISDFVWDQEFSNAKFANAILTSIPNTRPAYTTAQGQALAGVVLTMKALQFMMIAETRDSLGVSVYSILSTGGVPAPVLCNQDVWKYIVAVLDSANADLNAAGATPIPVTLPSGFAAVDQFAGPSTAGGSFAAFNRALAGKAGLELAYAIARQTGAGATATTQGTPDPTALVRADSAINASALYNPGALTTPSPGGFNVNDPYSVYHVFSGQSGDLVNPVNGMIGTMATMWDLVVDVDTINDARWQAKFAVNPNQVQQAAFNAVASPYIYAYYASPSSPIPIVRDEELTLVEAQIQLAQGKYAGALALVNMVHQKAGGFASPLSVPNDYLDVRDALLKEQRISTALEASGDRNISIRLYGLPTVSDTTWNATNGPDAVGVATAEASLGASITDQHTTVLPIPETEIDGRGGSYTISCP